MRAGVPSFSHGEKMLVKVELKATVVPLLVEDEMKRCHTVSTSRAHATSDI